MPRPSSGALSFVRSSIASSASMAESETDTVAAATTPPAETGASGGARGAATGQGNAEDSITAPPPTVAATASPVDRAAASTSADHARPDAPSGATSAASAPRGHAPHLPPGLLGGVASAGFLLEQPMQALIGPTTPTSPRRLAQTTPALAVPQTACPGNTTLPSGAPGREVSGAFTPKPATQAAPAPAVGPNQAIISSSTAAVNSAGLMSAPIVSPIGDSAKARTSPRDAGAAETFAEPAGSSSEAKPAAGPSAEACTEETAVMAAAMKAPGAVVSGGGEAAALDGVVRSVAEVPIDEVLASTLTARERVAIKVCGAVLGDEKEWGRVWPCRGRRSFEGGSSNSSARPSTRLPPTPTTHCSLVSVDT